MRRVVITSLLAVVMAVGPWLAAPAHADGPSATLDRGSASPGDMILVRGIAWPVGSVVQAEVCGNQALNGSLDCARGNAVTTGVAPDGRFGLSLPAVVPPAPCPCVVLITSMDAPTILSLPIEITGAPTAPPSQATTAVAIFTVPSITVTGSRSLGSLVGLRDSRTLQVKVRNAGSIATPQLPISVSLSSNRGDEIASGSVAPLAPGEERTVEVVATTPALSFGSHSVLVTVGHASQAITKSVSFSTVPWVLIAAVLVVLLWLVAIVFKRRSGRSVVGDPGHVDSAGPWTRAVPIDVRDTPKSLEEEMTAFIAAALHDWGPIPPGTDTSALAAVVAAGVVEELVERHLLDRSEQDALEMSLRTELAEELAGLFAPA